MARDEHGAGRAMDGRSESGLLKGMGLFVEEDVQRVPRIQ